MFSQINDEYFIKNPRENLFSGILVRSGKYVRSTVFRFSWKTLAQKILRLVQHSDRIKHTWAAATCFFENYPDIVFALV